MRVEKQKKKDKTIKKRPKQKKNTKPSKKGQKTIKKVQTIKKGQKTIKKSPPQNFFMVWTFFYGFLAFF